MREYSTEPKFSVQTFSPLGVRKNQLRFFLRSQLLHRKPNWRFDGLELPIYKATNCAFAVRFDAHQHTRRCGGGLVMGKGTGIKMFYHPLPAGRRINRGETGGERLHVAGPAEGQHMIPAQYGFECATNFGPELNLAGYGSLHGFAGDPGVQQERI